MAEEKFAMCETHLETIEDAIRYIYEQSMTMNKPEEIGFQLDNLLTDVDETAELLDAMDLETHESQSQEYYSENELDELLTQIQERKIKTREAQTINEAGNAYESANAAKSTSIASTANNSIRQ